MRVAFVYDRINKWGGAERMLLALHEIWPKAPLYTAVYDSSRTPWARVFKVVPSFLNSFPFARGRHELYPWLTPIAFESFDFTGWDVVISVTSEAAKGIITKPETLHICYCLTPTRYLWSGYNDYFQSSLFRRLSTPGVVYLRKWDKVAAQRPDVFWAISKNVKQRIRKYYARGSEVIYPPVDGLKFKVQSSKFKVQTKDYFLIVSRLVNYKNIDIAIKAFNQLGLPLKIIGTGSQMGRLRKMARPNIDFLGQLTDRELLGYYHESQAVIFPQVEDFGLVPLEAQACGRPVIAFKGGGALETVIENRTGLFFYPQTAEALAKTVLRYKDNGILRKKICSENCRRNAEKFYQERFKKNFRWRVEKIWQQYLKKS